MHRFGTALLVIVVALVSGGFAYGPHGEYSVVVLSILKTLVDCFGESFHFW